MKTTLVALALAVMPVAAQSQKQIPEDIRAAAQMWAEYEVIVEMCHPYVAFDDDAVARAMEELPKLSKQPLIERYGFGAWKSLTHNLWAIASGLARDNTEAWCARRQATIEWLVPPPPKPPSNEFNDTVISATQACSSLTKLFELDDLRRRRSPSYQRAIAESVSDGVCIRLPASAKVQVIEASPAGVLCVRHDPASQGCAYVVPSAVKTDFDAERYQRRQEGQIQAQLRSRAFQARASAEGTGCLAHRDARGSARWCPAPTRWCPAHRVLVIWSLWNSPAVRLREASFMRRAGGSETSAVSRSRMSTWLLNSSMPEAGSSRSATTFRPLIRLRLV